MNRLTLKALLLSVITELQFGQPLAPNAGIAKKEYKKLVGLKPRSTNESVLACLQYTYTENGFKEDFDRIIKRFKAEEFLPTEPLK